MSALQELRTHYAEVRRRLNTPPAHLRLVKVEAEKVAIVAPTLPPPDPRIGPKDEWQGPVKVIPRLDHEADARAIAEAYGVTMEEVRDPGRKPKYVPARKAIARMLHERGWSFPRIARFLGRSDHTSAIHWIRGSK